MENKIKKTIGVTFGIPDRGISMFNNGHRQNVLYFFEVLCLLGYDVYLIIDKPLIKDMIGFDYSKYKTIIYTEDTVIFNKNFDIIFQFGFRLDSNFLKKIRSKSNCKIIAYKSGNDYIIDMEHVLFSTKTADWPQHAEILNEKIFDEIWCIPQHENTNYYYWKTLYKCPVIVVPFIWSPYTIENICKEENVIKNNGIYVPKNKLEPKSIAIFEPNLNIVKYALPAVLVCENMYSNIENKDRIKHLYITNIPKDEDKNFNKTQFSRMTYSLNLYKDKKISIEPRFILNFFMSKYADIAVSHQWENPLNYLYLELAWMGHPILHNAYLCKDIGYYYEGFNYEQGGKVLEDILETHDNNVEYYIKKNRKIIDRYLPTNKDLQLKYMNLIERL